MRLTVILAALALGACTTTPAMESALAPLAGRPVQLVFGQLGLPSSSAPVGQDTVYEWHRAKLVHGAVSRATAVGAGSQLSFGGSSGAVPYTCHVRILADGEGRIKDWQFGEQTGGCRESARSLSQLANLEPR